MQRVTVSVRLTFDEIAHMGSGIQDAIIENQDSMFKSWNEMFVWNQRRHRSMPRRYGWLNNRIKCNTDKWNGINLSRLQKWTAWIIHVDEIGNKRNYLTRAFIPCFPQRALPLAVKVEKTEIWVSATRPDAEVFISWKTSNLLSSPHKIKYGANGLWHTKS